MSLTVTQATAFFKTAYGSVNFGHPITIHMNPVSAKNMSMLFKNKAELKHKYPIKRSNPLKLDSHIIIYPTTNFEEYRLDICLLRFKLLEIILGEKWKLEIFF